MVSGLHGKWGKGLTYDELTVGTVYHTEWAVMTKEEIMDFASQYDPQYMHLDEAKANASIFGGIIASGLHTFSIASRLWVQTQVMGEDIVGGLGIDNLRFTHPVRPGDAIRVIVTIANKRVHPRQPNQGIVSFGMTVVNQEETPVLQATLIGLVKRQPD
ncbi:MAG: acyl dehydratase [Sulfobacillus benefaciens]|uniref:Acyl dehydratase n=1 Tax=Sulfobacillus benefaciens TaxID=453960 RepID=A0A2T2XE25_9FIRM|nr:MAG: acyl dehydratase [Sulfobacillus benefaciens]